jgi:hypothetical protein
MGSSKILFLGKVIKYLLLKIPTVKGKQLTVEYFYFQLIFN